MRLTEALTSLGGALAESHFPLALPDRASAQQSTDQITGQLNDYVLPRLANFEAPLLTVVGGSTGAGKSTLVNSLIARVVSQPGVIRPTTRSPVLVYNPSDEHWFDDERILPRLTRSKVSSQDQRSIQLVAESTLPVGLAILDAPDIDSVVAENRALAAQLLDAADLWLFVTSAARYADAVPWEFLHTAARRGASLSVVLDRVPAGAMGEIPADLGRLMSEQGLADAPLFAVPETVVDDLGLLPDPAVAPIRRYLATLVADKTSRQNLVKRTLQGAITSMLDSSTQIADVLDGQRLAAEQLAGDAQKSFDEACRAVGVQSADGTLLRGEVLGRWHDYVGTGDMMRSLDRGVSRLRDRIAGFFTGQADSAEKVGVAAGNGLEILINAEAAAAAERATLAWKANPAGRELLQHHPELAKPSPQLSAATAKAIRDWQSDVLDLVTNEGKGKRASARIAALSVNGVGAALMLVIFFNTGGISGAEGGVAVGTTVLAQRLLESIFGDEAVRKLAKVAKEELDARVKGLMATELARFTHLVDQLGVGPDDAMRVRNAIAEIRRCQSGDEGPSDVQIRNSPAASKLPSLTRGRAAGMAEPSLSTSDDQLIVDAELVPSEQEAVRADG